MSVAVRSARVTINDVARHVGVSRQTVSNALNFPARVHPATLATVRTAIEALGYRPSASAVQLRRRRAGAIGVELNAIGLGSSDVAHPFLVALTVAAPRFDYHLVPFASSEPTPMLAGHDDMVRRHLVDAFVIADTHRGDPRPAWLAERGIPWAAFGRIYDDPTATQWVDVDGRAGTAAAVEHLVGRGYRRIGYLGWPPGSAVGDDRHAGWLDGCRHHGAEPGPIAVSEQDTGQATVAAVGLLDELGREGAVVCASDVLAFGVLHAALQRQWTPGPDVGIVGFDGSSAAVMSGLTTVVQPLDDIAVRLLDVIGHLLAGGSPPAAGSLLKPSLHLGASTEVTKKGNA